jgi:hypothetical protein
MTDSPIEQREFERKQGSMALDVSAGFLRDPNGEKIAQPDTIRAEGQAKSDALV